MSEEISQSEAGRRWGISHTAVRKYVEGGMPTTARGRLAWPEVDEWRKRFVAPARSGSYKARRRAAAGKARTGRSEAASVREDASRMASRADDFARGYQAARSDLRESMPILIAVNGDKKTLESRIRSFLVTDALFARWAEIYGLDGAEPAVAIDWSVCSQEIQKLAVKVDAEFAALRTISLRTAAA